MDEFNYYSQRAREARLSKYINNFLVKTLLVLLILLGLAGFIYLCFFQHNSLGWLCLLIAIFASMLHTWIVNEIAKVPRGPTDDINDILSTNVLKIMPKTPTPQDLARSLSKTRSGKFLSFRFGITPSLLQEVAKDCSPNMTPVFTIARGIWHEVDGEVISGGMLAIAIIQNHPQNEQILRRLKLDFAALCDGMRWYNHLHGLVESARVRQRDGGIARDLTFGYIPLLQKFGRNLSTGHNGTAGTQVHLATHREIVNKMISIFSHQGRQNIALVGPAGSGRSTIVSAFAEAIMNADANISANLKYRQVFLLDAAALISVASERGQIENLVTRILNEAYAAKNIILCLDNAQLFFEDGTGSINIANILLPILEAGNLRIILTMDEQKFLEISAQNSALTNALNKTIVPPANQRETMDALEDKVPLLEAKYKVICTYWALTESYRLSERYIHDLAMPGRALNLLESACNYPRDGFIDEASVQQAIERTQGVRLQTSTTETERGKLLQLEDLIHERMIDQTEAVQAVSDALRRAAAGVRDEKRPIGAFLFLGPTGVGKTELAKALSEVYFNGEKSIIRLDMNEYVTANDVNRLIADGAENSESLTAQVMKRPFSVVLLDEIEKAHPLVLTTLLQMLDEGILRDSNNHEVSFRDTIIIATSNAGADQIRTQIANGTDLTKIKDQLTDAMIKSGQFKPEFLNRFDEICIFKPLSKPDLIKIVGLMIDSVNKTLAPQKISVVLTDDAKELLVERGYDPQMGARPLRRVVQKSIENLVAKLVLSGSAQNGSTITITKELLEDTERR